MKKNYFNTMLRNVFLWGLLILQLFPLILMFINSFRSNQEISTFPIGWPDSFSITNYIDTWNVGGYATAFKNSLLVGGVTIVCTLILICPAAYAISKMHFKGKRFLKKYFSIALAAPAFAYLIPVYYLFNKFGLINSLAGLTLLYIARNIPFHLLLLITFLSGIPSEIIESAKVDGCSEAGAFLRVVLPNALPTLLTISLLIFLNCWNEFLFANTFLTSDTVRTVATRFIRFTTQFTNDYAKIYTAGVITIFPIVLLYLSMQKRFIDGLTSGSVKG